MRESLAGALRLVLERLPPKERLVFLLREAFDYEYEEIAKIIRKSATNCRQMLGRAVNTSPPAALASSSSRSNWKS